MENPNHEDGKEVKVANKSLLRGSDLVLRFFAFATTLTAAVTLGLDKQTKMMSVTVSPTLPPITVAVTSKWHYLSASVFFVVANAIACAYTAISIPLVLLASRGGKKKGLITMFIITMDLFTVALLFSGNAALLTISVLAINGNRHVQWNKVCNIFGKFCNQATGAGVVSLVGALAFILLVFLATLNLHRKSR